MLRVYNSACQKCLRKCAEDIIHGLPYGFNNHKKKLFIYIDIYTYASRYVYNLDFYTLIVVFVCMP